MTRKPPTPRTSSPRQGRPSASIDALRESDPELYDYISRLESDAAAQARLKGHQRRALGWTARLSAWTLFGGDLYRATRRFTQALDAWIDRQPDPATRRPPTFPTEALGQVGAAITLRVVRVGAIGALLALLPATMLVVQTSIMWRQNQLVQDQFAQQRRAQLLNLLYEPMEGCRPKANEPCQARASARARAEAARGLMELASADATPLDLSAADLSDTRLTGTSLRALVLSGALIRRADLSGSDLTDADLRRADLSNIDADRLTLRAGRLNDASLEEASLTHAVLDGVQAQGADLSDSDLTDASLRRASLERARLNSALLLRADLSEAILIETSFESADLTDANLRGARIQGANFKGATLKGVDLRGARYDRLTSWPPGFDPSTKGATPLKNKTP